MVGPSSPIRVAGTIATTLPVPSRHAPPQQEQQQEEQRQASHVADAMPSWMALAAAISQPQAPPPPAPMYAQSSPPVHETAAGRGLAAAPLPQGGAAALPSRPATAVVEEPGAIDAQDDGDLMGYEEQPAGRDSRASHSRPGTTGAGSILSGSHISARTAGSAAGPAATSHSLLGDSAASYDFRLRPGSSRPGSASQPAAGKAAAAAAAGKEGAAEAWAAATEPAQTAAAQAQQQFLGEMPALAKALNSQLQAVQVRQEPFATHTNYLLATFMSVYMRVLPAHHAYTGQYLYMKVAAPPTGRLQPCFRVTGRFVEFVD